MRNILTLGLAASLAACATLMKGGDPQVAARADAIGAEAQAYFTALADKTSPECDLAHNAAAYDRLDLMALQLQADIATAKGSLALDRAAKALARTLADARESHALASANSSDPSGTCLAPGALALNRDAIARASTAIAVSQGAQ